MEKVTVQVKVVILSPQVVTAKMAFGALCAWLFRNHLYLAKYGWKFEVLDYKERE